jgi:ABC-type taurine transport system substrate-binding protein
MSRIADPLRCLALAVLEHAIQELARTGRSAELLQPVVTESPARLAGADSRMISTPFDKTRDTRLSAYAMSTRRAQFRYAANAQRWLLEDAEMVQAWCRLGGISARRYYRAACERLNNAGHPGHCIERAIERG